MFSHTRCLLTLAIVPSLAFAQKDPPPAVDGRKIDPVPATADPVPPGIKDLLVFRGPLTDRRPPAIKSAPVPIKGLSPADKLALLRSAATTSGESTRGRSIAPYLMFSRAVMRTEGRGRLVLVELSEVADAVTTISPHGDINPRSPTRGTAILWVYPEAAGQLYLAEFQVSRDLHGPPEERPETTCRAGGPDGSVQTFTLRGSETNIVPMVFESTSSDLPHGLTFYCGRHWNFISVEVSVLR